MDKDTGVRLNHRWSLGSKLPAEVGPQRTASCKPWFPLLSPPRAFNKALTGISLKPTFFRRGSQVARWGEVHWWTLTKCLPMAPALLAPVSMGVQVALWSQHFERSQSFYPVSSVYLCVLVSGDVVKGNCSWKNLSHCPLGAHEVRVVGVLQRRCSAKS